MSPEQLRNSKSVDPRSDLWSLSTVFYEMLCGRDPYGATTDFARLTAVFTQDAIPIDRDLPGLANWREFFVRAFNRDINLRFQSAEDMVRCIDEAALGHELPPVGAPISPPAPPAPVPPPRAPQHSADALAATAHQIHVPINLPPAPVRPPTTSTPAVTAPAPLAVAPPATPVVGAAPAGGSSKIVWALVCVVLVIATVIAILAIKSFQEKVPEPAGATTNGAKAPPPSTPPKKKLAGRVPRGFRALFLAHGGWQVW
jgi:serine/threonine-protein kinase